MPGQSRAYSTPAAPVLTKAVLASNKAASVLTKTVPASNKAALASSKVVMTSHKAALALNKAALASNEAALALIKHCHTLTVRVTLTLVGVLDERGVERGGVDLVEQRHVVKRLQGLQGAGFKARGLGFSERHRYKNGERG